MLNEVRTQALHRAPSPLSFPESPLAGIARQPMMIGLFLPTQTGSFGGEMKYRENFLDRSSRPSRSAP